MANVLKQSASLANLEGQNFPPIALSVSAQYQFCVDAGASAAVEFFNDLAEVGLHDHIARALHSFCASIRTQTADTDSRQTGTMQCCVDAFAAGYLGRIQQELRLFKDEPQKSGDAGQSSNRRRSTH